MGFRRGREGKVKMCDVCGASETCREPARPGCSRVVALNRRSTVRLCAGWRSRHAAKASFLQSCICCSINTASTSSSRVLQLQQPTKHVSLRHNSRRSVALAARCFCSMSHVLKKALRQEELVKINSNQRNCSSAFMSSVKQSTSRARDFSCFDRSVWNSIPKCLRNSSGADPGICEGGRGVPPVPFLTPSPLLFFSPFSPLPLRSRAS